MKLVTALVILTLQTAAAMEPVKEVDSQATLIPYQTIPGFYQGYVFWVEKPGHVRLFSPDGHLTFDEYVQQDLAPSVMSLAVHADGTVAVSYSNESRAGIELLDSTGKSVSSFDTGKYLAAHIAFADDHSIWTFGWQRDPLNPKAPAADYMTVHHYAANGREMGEYLPRASFPIPKRAKAACRAWSNHQIYVANDRIGLLACSGPTYAEWVELDLKGDLIGRWQMPQMIAQRVAFTRDAHLYVQEAANTGGHVLTLDRLSSGLQPVPWTISGPMYGADGDELVFAGWNTPQQMHFRWYKQP